MCPDEPTNTDDHFIDDDGETSGVDEMTMDELRANLRYSMKLLADAEEMDAQAAEDHEQEMAQIVGWLRFRGWEEAAKGLEQKEWYGFDPVAGAFRVE